MLRYITRRMIQMVPSVFVMSIVIFSITMLLPGDVAVTILGMEASPEQVERLRERLGLDDPVHVQYFRWLSRLLQGDLGRSFRTHQPVVEMLIQRIPVTLELTFFSMILSVLIGVPAGILSATKRGTWIDTVATFAALFGVAMPFFWLGILLILIFSIFLKWLPPSGYLPFVRDPIQNLKLMILPSITIGTAMAAVVMRQMRAAILEVLEQDYIRTARAKGVHEHKVMYRHALRNALIPVITVIGLQMGALIGGAVVTETVFALSGIGRMVVDGIFQRDYPAIQGAILVIVTGVLIVNLFVDIIYAFIDPRIEL